jgi:hypothetical protein
MKKDGIICRHFLSLIAVDQRVGALVGLGVLILWDTHSTHGLTDHAA